MKKVDAVVSITSRKAKNLADGLQNIENCTKRLFFGDFQLCFVESMILLHHLAVIFKKVIYK